MKFLDFFIKRAPDRKPSDKPVAKRTEKTGSRKRVVPTNIEMTTLQAMQHPVIFRCSRKIAEAVQVVKWEARPTKTNPANKTTLAKVQAVLDNPTNEHTAEQFKYWLALNLALPARVGIKIGVGAEGLPNALYPLQVGKLHAETDKLGRIKEYTYGDEKQKIPSRFSSISDDGKTFTRSFASEIIIPGVEGDMTSDRTGTPLYAIGKPAQIIKLLMDRAIETAEGTPNSKYIVTSKRPLTTPQNDELEEFLEESAVSGADSGTVLTLTGVEMELHKLDNDLSDMHSKVPADDMTRHIASVFGVPLSLIGIGASDSAKFANNYNEGRLSFYQDTIIPGYLSPIASSLSNIFENLGVEIVFNIDSIPALEEAKAKRAKTVNEVDFLTPNEKREMCGYETRNADDPDDEMNKVTLNSNKPKNEDLEGQTNE